MNGREAKWIMAGARGRTAHDPAVTVTGQALCTLSISERDPTRLGDRTGRRNVGQLGGETRGRARTAVGLVRTFITFGRSGCSRITERPTVSSTSLPFANPAIDGQTQRSKRRSVQRDDTYG